MAGITEQQAVLELYVALGAQWTHAPGLCRSHPVCSSLSFMPMKSASQAHSGLYRCVPQDKLDVQPLAH